MNVPPQLQAMADITSAVYLLIITEPRSGTSSPLAIAFAVRSDLLLTSGAVVQQLAKAQEKGMGVAAMHCLTQRQEEVTSLYLQPDYGRLADRPQDQIFTDVGAVQVSGKSRALAQLAAATDAADLEQGTPLRCVMPVFEAEPPIRFDNTKPAYHDAKIYMVTRRGDMASPPETHPRLLSLVGALPDNAYGSPIVNSQGQVVAMYVEKADLSNDQSLAGLVNRYHYAVSLDWLRELRGGSLSAWPCVTRKPNKDSAREYQ